MNGSLTSQHIPSCFTGPLECTSVSILNSSAIECSLATCVVGRYPVNVSLSGQNSTGTVLLTRMCGDDRFAFPSQSCGPCPAVSVVLLSLRFCLRNLVNGMSWTIPFFPCLAERPMRCIFPSDATLAWILPRISDAILDLRASVCVSRCRCVCRASNIEGPGSRREWCRHRRLRHWPCHGTVLHVPFVDEWITGRFRVGKCQGLRSRLSNVCSEISRLQYLNGIAICRVGMFEATNAEA